MARFQGTSDYRHGSESCLGVLLVNLGTPSAPTASAVRRYLGEFLWDPRVVEIPRPVWWLILNGIILNTRPKRSAHAYSQVWREDGSPLLAISRLQRQALEADLQARFKGPVKTTLAMRYGEPSVRNGLAELQAAGARRVLVLPLYPQYSATTTGSVFDAVTSELQSWRRLPELRFVNSYADDAGYIKAMAARVRKHWEAHPRADQLMFSFHGLPKRNLLEGDPYHCECHQTARLLAAELDLDDARWRTCFQSRFGRQEWLQPYSDQTLKGMPGEGIKSVDVFCPGFPADCLETLEEMALQNRDVFMAAGGERYTYIEAVNDMPEHIQALGDLVARHVQGWPEVESSGDPQQRVSSRERALAMGAKQ